MRRRFTVNGVNFCFRTNQCSVQGDRKYQEDQLLVIDDEDFLCFAVFDGHGGKEAAVFAKENLLKFIKQQKGFGSPDPREMCQAVREGFQATQEAILNAVKNWPRTGSGHMSTSGTTVSLVIVDVRHGRMYVAHVGDSRVLLGSQESSSKYSNCLLDDSNSMDSHWECRPLTVDHKPESEEERERIEEDGGSIVVKYNVSRVVWYRCNQSGSVDRVPFLSIARSLGDLWSFNETSGRYVVSPIPDVDYYELRPEFRCLILGSDGLFNMVANEEAVSLVEEVECSNGQAEACKNMFRQSHSAELVTRALTRWRSRQLRSDNISVLTVGITTDIEEDEDDTYDHEIENNERQEDDEGENLSDGNETMLNTRPPLNHLNQNRTCGLKRSRSLDSVSPKRPRLHLMDLRGGRDRACKRASSTTKC